MNRWEAGRANIEKLLAEQKLERVAPSREMADQLIAQGRAHLVSAAAVAQADPEGGYALAYDAARKALSSVLENQGLRVRSAQGHHAILYEAVVAQLHPPLGPRLRSFEDMRKLRRGAEYPRVDEPPLHADDVEDAVESAADIVDVCAGVLDHMPPFLTATSRTIRLSHRATCTCTVKVHEVRTGFPELDRSNSAGPRTATAPANACTTTRPSTPLRPSPASATAPCAGPTGSAPPPTDPRAPCSAAGRAWNWADVTITTPPKPGHTRSLSVTGRTQIAPDGRIPRARPAVTVCDVPITNRDGAS